MAKDALDIVPVAEARVAMRIVGEDSQHDALIASYLAGAGAWIENLCGIGVIDTPAVAICDAPRGDDPLVIRHRSHTIAGATARPANDPTAATTPLAVNSASVPGDGVTLLDKPAGGWPAPVMAVRYTRTTPADKVPGAIRAAIILLCRDMYDMREELGSSGGVGSGRPWAVYSMIAPYRDARLSLEDVGWPDPAPVKEFPLDPATPTAPVIRLRAAWKATNDFAASDFTAEGATASATSSIVLPDGDGQLFLGVWRSDATGGAISHLEGPNIFGALPVGEAVALEVNDRHGHYTPTSGKQNATLLSGETVRVS